MQLHDIAWLNLRRRKAKAAFVLAGLLVGVAVVVALVSLTSSLGEQVNNRLEKYGANILITPRSESLSLSYEGLSLGGFSFQTREIRQASLAGIATIKNAANVAAVGPMVLGAVKVRGKDVLLAGVDFKTLKYLKPWWQVKGSLPGPGQVVLGAEAARVLGAAQGQGIAIKGRGLMISGVLSPTGSQDDGLIFAPLAQAQQMLGKVGLVSMVEVAALCRDCPVDAMVRQIAAVIPGAKVTAIQSVVKGRMQTIAHFKRFGLGVSALVVLVGSLVVLVTMMGSVRERTGEIGIFRAMGFRRGHVMRVILIEALLVSLAAGALGWLLGLAACWLALPLFGGNGPPLVQAWLAAGALGLALVVGLGASIYPALLAARLDPQEALRSL